jgi:hypothetical protein
LFFIINNLLVFTIASTVIGLYKQIQSTVSNGDTVDILSLFRSNLNLMAKSFASKYFAHLKGSQKSLFSNTYMTIRCQHLLDQLCHFGKFYAGAARDYGPYINYLCLP